MEAFEMYLKGYVVIVILLYMIDSSRYNQG